jgi:hypothetical protein
VRGDDVIRKIRGGIGDDRDRCSHARSLGPRPVVAPATSARVRTGRASRDVRARPVPIIGISTTSSSRSSASGRMPVRSFPGPAAVRPAGHRRVGEAHGVLRELGPMTWVSRWSSGHRSGRRPGARGAARAACHRGREPRSPAEGGARHPRKAGHDIRGPGASISAMLTAACSSPT